MLLNEIAEERGLTISETFRAILREVRKTEAINQILINTSYLRVATMVAVSKMPINDEVKSLWENEKENLGVLGDV